MFASVSNSLVSYPNDPSVFERQEISFIKKEINKMNPGVTNKPIKEKTNKVPINDKEERVPHKKTVLVLDGGIGSGKSTLMKILKKEWKTRKLNLQYFQEPVDVWSGQSKEHPHNYLGEYYSDQERNSFLFQMEVMRTKQNIFNPRKSEINSHSFNNNPNVMITERSPFSDKIFASLCHKNGKMRTCEFDLFSALNQRFCDELLEKCEFVFCYIESSPEDNHKKMVKRNRSEEKTVPMGYLQQLEKVHNDLYPQIIKNSNYPLIQISNSFVSGEHYEEHLTEKAQMIIDKMEEIIFNQ